MDETVAALRKTLDAREQKNADETLRKLSNCPSFLPQLMSIASSQSIDLNVRHAASVYLKNIIRLQWWDPKALSAYDKNFIRVNLLPALTSADPPILKQLVESLRFIIHTDFPTNWTEIHSAMQKYLDSRKANVLYSGLIVLHQLIRNFEFKGRDEKSEFLEYCIPLFPTLLNGIFMFLDNQSDESLRVQHLILKSLARFIQLSLPLQCLTVESLNHLMNALCTVVKRVDERDLSAEGVDDPGAHPLWRCCKWSARMINRMMEKYGSPKTVCKEYAEFSTYFIKGFSEQIFHVCLAIFVRFSRSEFVLESVIFEFLIYLSRACSYKFKWDLMNAHVPFILEKVVYPKLCISEEEEILFEDEPVDFMNLKHDLYGDFESSAYASRTFLSAACSKREIALHHTMCLCQRLVSEFASLDYKQKDGLFHMIGTLHRTLAQKVAYKSSIQDFLVQTALPEVKSSKGCLRFRALWLMEIFRKFPLSEESIIQFVNAAYNCMMNDESDVVKVQACSVVVRYALHYKSLIRPVLKQHLRVLVVKMLELIRTVAYDEVPRLFRRLLTLLQSELAPIAADITGHLVDTFTGMMSETPETDDEGAADLGECTSLAASEILQVLTRIIDSVNAIPETFINIEQPVCSVIVFILTDYLVDFYCELGDLIFAMTKYRITSRMWEILPLVKMFIYELGSDYFLDMVAGIYNYIRVDSIALFQHQDRLDSILSILTKNFNSLMPLFLLGSTFFVSFFSRSFCIWVYDNTDCLQSAQFAAKFIEIIAAQASVATDKGFYKHLVGICTDRLILIDKRFKEIKEENSRTLHEETISALRSLFVCALLNLLHVDAQLCLAEFTRSKINFEQFVEDYWLNQLTAFASMHSRSTCMVGIADILSLFARGFIDKLPLPNTLGLCVAQVTLAYKYSTERKDSVADAPTRDVSEPSMEVEEYFELSDGSGDITDNEPDQDGDVIRRSRFSLNNTTDERSRTVKGNAFEESEYQNSLDRYTTSADDSGGANALNSLHDALEEMRMYKLDYYKDLVEVLRENSDGLQVRRR